MVMQLAKPTGYWVFSVLLIVYVEDEVLDIVTAADDCVVDGVSRTYGAAHDSGPVRSSSMESFGGMSTGLHHDHSPIFERNWIYKHTMPEENNTSAFVNDFLAGWDDDDPFRSPSPDAADKNKANSKKRKEPDTLGIDKEIDVTKKARVPRVKLDDARLLSDKGIPKLRKTAPKLKLKGKGHEFSDAARLLSFYQEWLDDLFPKATFVDALAMCEKAGHKTTLRNARLKWIAEGKPRSTGVEYEEDGDREERSSAAPIQPTRMAPIFEKAAGARSKTPTADDDDLFGDDIYNATPRRNQPAAAPGDVPDDDDMDALMAEAEFGAAPGANKTTNNGTVSGSIFGGGATAKRPQATEVPDDDDLDALMAEAESYRPSTTNNGSVFGNTSIFGGGKDKPATAPPPEEDDDDLDALMAEAEMHAAVPIKATEKVPTSKEQTGGKEGGQNASYDEDDLDALMAEAEAYTKTTNTQPAQPKNVDEDLEAEAAMAEMDGF
ncbi:replication fork protection component Swi3-domain-containing protein [Pseudoneurospora amorphoporcata]|uniref:Chromosome segregation in meiosis protein n=1 Tax=Pseudoneurospora amorphoporcata TaxID=241081 RepID=A0AAN6NR64_9PEZI|nr:replication fork protection component Swi3-domain-containing protein [Pseudoneurospora amorphoporcata]